MKYEASTPAEYVRQLPEERKKPFAKLRATLRKNLPQGFKEEMSYNMIGYIVPFSLYPDGYHCDNSLPLPFINLASQKNYIALYHMGIYSDSNLNSWFTSEYKKYTGLTADMGKSCIRFKKLEAIPYDLVAQLATKITPQQWIRIYEKSRANVS